MNDVSIQEPAQKRKFNWRFVLKVVGIITLVTPVLLYVGLSPIVCNGLYSQGLLFPTKYPSPHYARQTIRGITGKDIFFNASNGNKLHGWYFAQPNAK